MLRLFSSITLLVLLAVGPIASAQNFTLAATYGDVELAQGFLPDPHSVELTAGGSIDTNVGGCTYGYVADAPDVKFRYTANGSSTLYLYVSAGDDTTLLINTPSGTWMCDDDSYGSANPIVVIPNAPSGRYDIWVGTYGDQLTPATLYLSEIDPRGQAFSGNGSAPNMSLDPTYGTVTLSAGFLPDPHSVELTAGGSVDVNVGGCAYGYVADAPDIKFSYTASGKTTLYIYAAAEGDVTLLINTATGTWMCDDDSYGNGDPVIVIPDAPSGRYDIWVGTYGDQLTPATLYLSEVDPR